MAIKRFFYKLRKFNVSSIFSLHASRRYSTSCQTFCNNGWSLFQPSFVLGTSSCSKLSAMAESNPPPTRKSRAGSGPEIAEARKWTALDRAIAQATAYSRTFSPHRGCWETFGLSWSWWGINHNCKISRMVSRHLKSDLYSSGKSWNYFLSMSEKKSLFDLLFTVAWASISVRLSLS
jgi:hypothetical protein